MQAIFIIVWVLGWIFFLKNRYAIPMAFIAYLGCSYYFYPGLLGYCQVPLSKEYVLSGGLNTTPIELIDSSYYAMLIGLLAVIAAGVVSMLSNRNRRPRTAAKMFDSRLFLAALTATNIFGFLFLIIFSGWSIFFKEKLEIMEQVNNRGYVIWATSTGIGFTLSYYVNNRRGMLWFGLMLVADLYIGFRSTTVFCLLSILAIMLERKKLTMRIVAGAAMIFAFLLIYKNTLSIVKLQRWDLLADRVQSVDFYTDSLLNSEPMVTQAILNQALQDGAHYQPMPLKYYIMQSLPFTREILNADYRGAYFSGNVLFPGLDYGVASNSWAELLVTYGKGTYLIFISIFGLVIVWADRLYLQASPGIWKTMVAVNSALLFFYNYRNTLLYQYNMHRQYAYEFFMAFAVYVVIALAKRGRIWFPTQPGNLSQTPRGKGIDSLGGRGKCRKVLRAQY